MIILWFILFVITCIRSHQALSKILVLKVFDKQLTSISSKCDEGCFMAVPSEIVTRENCCPLSDARSAREAMARTSEKRDPAWD
jgi:hypothetical protein